MDKQAVSIICQQISELIEDQDAFAKSAWGVKSEVDLKVGVRFNLHGGGQIIITRGAGGRYNVVYGRNAKGGDFQVIAEKGGLRSKQLVETIDALLEGGAKLGSVASSWVSRTAVIKKPLDKVVCAVASSPEAYATLGYFADDFLSGGCWVFAEALRRNLPGATLQALLAPKTGRVEHVVVAYMGRLYDAEGGWSPSNILQAFSQEFHRDVVLGPFDPNNPDGLECPKVIVDRLTALFAQALTQAGFLVPKTGTARNEYRGERNHAANKSVPFWSQASSLTPQEPINPQEESYAAREAHQIRRSDSKDCQTHRGIDGSIHASFPSGRSDAKRIGRGLKTGQARWGGSPQRIIHKTSRKRVAQDETYRGEHEAPDASSGFPIHDLTDAYPADFYAPDGHRRYPSGFNPAEEQRAWDILCRVKGKPHAPVKVYRAVPVQMTIEKQIAQILECKRLMQWRNKIPSYAPKPPEGVRYYDHLCNELERLQALPPEPARAKRTIMPGDWVTPSRAYAKDHLDANLNGEGVILSKTVPAGTLFTDADSLLEWGYDPSGYTGGGRKKSASKTLKTDPIWNALAVLLRRKMISQKKVERAISQSVSQIQL